MVISDKVVAKSNLNGPFYLGVDLGKPPEVGVMKHDYSAIAVVTKQPNRGQVRLVYYKRWPLGTPYRNLIGSV